MQDIDENTYWHCIIDTIKVNGVPIGVGMNEQEAIVVKAIKRFGLLSEKEEQAAHQRIIELKRQGKWIIPVRALRAKVKLIGARERYIAAQQKKVK